MMSLFEEPEWGTSQTFSYYPEASEISSALLEDSLKSFAIKRKKNNKQLLNKKQKTIEYSLQSGSTVSLSSNKQQKSVDNTNEKKKKKKIHKNLKDSTQNKKEEQEVLKTNKALSQISVQKQENAMVLKEVTEMKMFASKATCNSKGVPRQQNTEKSDIETQNDKVRIRKKKKKISSNKRNKYKALNIEEKIKKAKLLSNGSDSNVYRSLQNLARESIVKDDVSNITEDGRDRNTNQADSTVTEKAMGFDAKKTNNKTSSLDTCLQGSETSFTRTVGKCKPSERKVKNEKEHNVSNGIDSSTFNKAKSSSVFQSHGVTHTRISSEDKKKNKQKGILQNYINKENAISSSSSKGLCSSFKTCKAMDVQSRTERKDFKKDRIRKENVGNKNTKKDISENNDNTKDKVKAKKKIILKQNREECSDDSDLEFKEYEAHEVDNNLKEEIDSFIKKLNFDKYKSGTDIVEEITSSSELEHESDTNLDFDESISDEDDKEGSESSITSEAVNTAKQNEMPENEEEETVGNFSKVAVKDTADISVVKESSRNSVKCTPDKGSKLNLKILSKLLASDEKNDSNKTFEADAEASVPRGAHSLKTKMEEQLNAARFRFVNEQMYSLDSKNAFQIFSSNRESFQLYHKGFQSQVSKWPVNPLDLIIKWLKNKPKKWMVADFGCGEALLAENVPQENVHSFDLVALSPRVTVCDMAHTPLQSNSVDAVVFCLSLMGTNIKEFIAEANRILHEGGTLKIAEVESRFTDVNFFINSIKKFGFHCVYKDVSMKYFYMFEFKKHRNLKNRAVLPDVILKPCKYKKR
ncbi:25S rRNA (adenine645-N1)-methyltransferase [Halocaridina rubra]|uniref:Ribosomal RNA-processing protein 8 n=1 Tax=Halocaridina rubra TaxID=373956 RepID=A0AAN8WIU8_HALRR